MTNPLLSGLMWSASVVAVMVSLCRAVAIVGNRAAAVVGHSQGEIAAACVSRRSSLSDGARVVALRSQAIGRRARRRGGMVAVSLARDPAIELIQRWKGNLSLATVNSPGSWLFLEIQNP